MLSSIIKDKIRLYMNVQEFSCDKRLPTDAAWDKYFINTYNDSTAIRFYDEDFISYEIMWNCVFIKDFVSELGNGIKLFNIIKNVSRETNKPICAFIHKTNYKLLQIAQKRYNFKLGNMVGNQYLVIREVQ